MAGLIAVPIRRTESRAGNSRVVKVTTGAALTAFQEVQAGAAGVAIPLAAGVKLGYALTSAANATDAEISLY